MQQQEQNTTSNSKQHRDQNNKIPRGIKSTLKQECFRSKDGQTRGQPDGSRKEFHNQSADYVLSLVCASCV